MDGRLGSVYCVLYMIGAWVLRGERAVGCVG
jgi:hypothetical protein